MTTEPDPTGPTPDLGEPGALDGPMESGFVLVDGDDEAGNEEQTA